MFERFLTASSTYARDVDSLILLILLFVGVWFIAAEFVFLGLIVKFREKKGVKSQYITGEAKHQKRWVSYPHYLVLVCDVFIVVGALKVWNEIKITMPEPDAKIRVIGQQWAWSFVHEGADGILDTDDDIRTVEEMHVEVGKTYHFLLEARDVLHSFSVPAFRLKQDAVPGREITGWFKATETGDFDIQCAEICGVAHGIMVARLVVDSPEDYAAWVNKGGPTAYWAASNVKVPNAAKPAAPPSAPTITATTAALLPL